MRVLLRLSYVHLPEARRGEASRVMVEKQFPILGPN